MVTKIGTKGKGDVITVFFFWVSVSVSNRSEREDVDSEQKQMVLFIHNDSIRIIIGNHYTVVAMWCNTR